MRKKICLALVSLAALIVFGCNTSSDYRRVERDYGGGTMVNGVNFPNQTAWGGVRGGSVSQLANTLVQSHNMAVIQQRQLRNVSSLTGERAQQLREAYQRNAGSAQMAHDIMARLAREGRGAETAVFFSAHSSSISGNSPQYRQLVELADAINRSRQNRKVIILA